VQLAVNLRHPPKTLRTHATNPSVQDHAVGKVNVGKLQDADGVVDVKVYAKPIVHPIELTGSVLRTG